MRKPALAMIIFLSLTPSYSYSADDLVEVNAKTQAKCVEYYTRNGVLFCSTKALSTEPVPPDIVKSEKQNIVFDERPWKFAWGKDTDKITTIEYVPMGENINQWKELITSQYLPQIPFNVNPRSFAEILIKDLEKKGFEPVVTFHKVTPDEVIFEFRIEKPANQVQDEIQVIRKGKNGFYILHYVVREFDMGKENRDKWLKNFSNSTLKE